MSYILEALRKSEQERNPEKVPDLATHHPQIHKQKSTINKFWLMGIGLVLTNVAVILYFLTKDVSSTDQPLVPDTTELVSGTSDVKPSQAAVLPVVVSGTKKLVSGTSESSEVIMDDVVIESEPVVEVTAQSYKNATETTKPVTTQQPTRQSDIDVLDVSDLPSAVQRRLPHLEFSTHIYIASGGSFVIINDTSYGDGMSITDELRIVKITSHGVILDFEGRRFLLKSMLSWN